ncbi:DUF4386 domain-containing protein [Pseudonocardia phyllosphaerae]|uniref:DUF4386 domain-containing protein n=1 Tax=Pseudonocardia phyllosphaerae TaxID=3390502 RepID=UPI00397B90B8
MATIASDRPVPLATGGPPLLVPAAALTVLTVAGAVLGGAGPRPDTAPAEVLAYDLAHPGTLGLGAALLFGSAFPLVVYAATALRRMERLGAAVPGPLIGYAGAVLAAASLSVSALASFVAARTVSLGDVTLARTLAWVWFGAGGPGFAAPMGLLVLGLAVPALLLRLIPRPLAVAGIVIGVLALLSVFSLAADVLYPLVPVGRFGGLLMLLGFALTLPTRPAGAR